MAEKPPLRCQIRADRGWSSAGSFPGTSRLGFEGLYDDEDDRLPRPVAFDTSKVSRSLLSECCLYRIIVAAAFTRINGLPAMYCAMHTHGRSAPSDLSPLKRRLKCQPALARRGTPIRYAFACTRRARVRRALLGCCKGPTCPERLSQRVSRQVAIILYTQHASGAQPLWPTCRLAHKHFRGSPRLPARESNGAANLR